MADVNSTNSERAGKQNQTLEVEADSLAEARSQLKSRIPEGMHLISDEVIADGKPKVLVDIAETVEAAFQKAGSRLPSSSIILEKKI